MPESPGAHGQGRCVCQGGLLTRILLTEALSRGAPGSYSELLPELLKKGCKSQEFMGGLPDSSYSLGLVWKRLLAVIESRVDEGPSPLPQNCRSPSALLGRGQLSEFPQEPAGSGPSSAGRLDPEGRLRAT